MTSIWRRWLSPHDFDRTFTCFSNLKLDKRFANFVKELEMRIWGSSHLIAKQNLKSNGDDDDDGKGADIQKKLWKLVKP